MRIFKSLNNSSFEIISVVVPQPCNIIFFWISASIADAAAVILNRAKIFFANGLLLSLMGLIFYLIMPLKTSRLSYFRYSCIRQLYMS